MEALEPAGGGRVAEPDDQRLVNALRAGRPEACAEVVRAHYAAVYRFLVHLTRDVHQAEDLTQETFAAAWEKGATFQGRASLATWGREALKDHPDPVVGGQFEYVAFEGGFELRSRWTVDESLRSKWKLDDRLTKPLTLSVGRRK